MPRTGYIWNYFTVYDRIKKKAQCNFCKNIYSYESTTSNLKYHLKLKHIVVHKELCRRNQSRRSGGFTPRIEDDKIDKLESDEVIMTVSGDSAETTFEYVEGGPEEADGTPNSDKDDKENPIETKNEDQNMYTEYSILNEDELHKDYYSESRPRRRRQFPKDDVPDWNANIDSFTTYIGSILKMLPRETVARFQVLIVQRLVKEQMKYV